MTQEYADTDPPRADIDALREPVLLEFGSNYCGICSATEPRVSAAMAAHPGVRGALLDRQRGFRELPGLVADGRDMGSVVFPDATLKVFLTADVGARAERRYKQLMGKGMYAKMQDVVEELRRRDERDTSRAVAPLKHYPDAIFLDTTGLSVAQAVERILGWWRERASR